MLFSSAFAPRRCNVPARFLIIVVSKKERKHPTTSLYRVFSLYIFRDCVWVEYFTSSEQSNELWSFFFSFDFDTDSKINLDIFHFRSFFFIFQSPCFEQIIARMISLGPRYRYSILISTKRKRTVRKFGSYRCLIHRFVRRLTLKVEVE